MIGGARQVGKSTLARKICDQRDGLYLSLDKNRNLHNAMTNPERFLSSVSDRLVVVDEIQRHPKLLLTVKMLIDDNRRAGMFLLTGSSDRYRMRHDYETLAGRKASVFMRPFSQMEIADRLPGHDGRPDGKVIWRNPNRAGKIDVNIVDELFSGGAPSPASCEGLQQRVALGGYPEAVINPKSKQELMYSYIETELVNEFTKMSHSEATATIPSLMRKLVGNQGKLINIDDLAREVGRTNFVTKNLVDLLGNAFVLEILPSLTEKLGTKYVSSKPKIYLNDSGLSATLLGLDGKDLTDSHHSGMLIETFVLSELRKHIETSTSVVFNDITYYRENNGIEVDFVLRSKTGEELVAVEVKASNQVSDEDWRNLDVFRLIAKGRCKRAVLLYTGDEVLTINDVVESWPISCLWNW